MKKLLSDVENIGDYQFNEIISNFTIYETETIAEEGFIKITSHHALINDIFKRDNGIMILTVEEYINNLDTIKKKTLKSLSKMCKSPTNTIRDETNEEKRIRVDYETKCCK
jgi:hypothetical protein